MAWDDLDFRKLNFKLFKIKIRYQRYEFLFRAKARYEAVFFKYSCHSDGFIDEMVYYSSLKENNKFIEAKTHFKYSDYGDASEHNNPREANKLLYNIDPFSILEKDIDFLFQFTVEEIYKSVKYKFIDSNKSMFFEIKLNLPKEFARKWIDYYDKYGIWEGIKHEEGYGYEDDIDLISVFHSVLKKEFYCKYREAKREMDSLSRFYFFYWYLIILVNETGVDKCYRLTIDMICDHLQHKWI